jgi:hypothetical protein
MDHQPIKPKKMIQTVFIRPVNFSKGPIRGEDNYLVLCEVFNADGMPHATNTRHLSDQG